MSTSPVWDPRRTPSDLTTSLCVPREGVPKIDGGAGQLEPVPTYRTKLVTSYVSSLHTVRPVFEVLCRTVRERGRCH